ncbi:MAG: DUF421 domain-containing protein [Cellulosilyticum sp.]|nr:DUF421 domain-containing protein [Cellulosilyticum sp.]
MNIIHVSITSLVTIIVLFITTKLLGYRQISHMSMFDYINSITIGSIAAELATSLKGEWQTPLTALIIFTVVNLLIDFATNKSIKLRRWINGKALILYDGGELYYKNLKKAKIDLGEFFMQCRNQNCFDLQQVQTVILEPNGKFSILFLSHYRPMTPNDVKLKPSSECVLANVIMEGKLLKENLYNIGRDEEWLMSVLRQKGYFDLSKIFLATCSIQGEVVVYKKLNQEKQEDILL